jgi:ribonuclease BN (tRNA processing enzyme)
MFSDGFDTHEYTDGEVFETCGVMVKPVRVPHYQLQTYALRVSDGSSTLAYSGDSAPSPHLAEVARDADLFLCEATLAREEPDLRGHLTEDEAVTAFRDSGARRLLVIHRPHELPLDSTLERAYDGWETTV